MFSFIYFSFVSLTNSFKRICNNIGRRAKIVFLHFFFGQQYSCTLMANILYSYLLKISGLGFYTICSDPSSMVGQILWDMAQFDDWLQSIDFCNPTWNINKFCFKKSSKFIDPKKRSKFNSRFLLVLFLKN